MTVLAGMVARGRRLLRVKIPAFFRKHRRSLITTAVSLAIHGIVLLVLAFWMLPPSTFDDLMSLLGGQVAKLEEESPLLLQEIVQPEQLTDLSTDSSLKQMVSELTAGMTSDQIDDPIDVPLQIPLDPVNELVEIPVATGVFAGRSTAGRQAALRKFGGTAESERSVNLGLRWLASIQRDDGSWCFAEVGNAADPGYLNTTDMGATSLALLCFLGAGHTHQTEGPWQKVVDQGLGYLLASARVDSAVADLRGSYQGNSGMYVQGISTICISEASALAPDDKRLSRLGSLAVKFIERSQDRTGGGWRYEPGERGDTSVVGWQVMALQSARSGGIRVSGKTLQNVRKFLNSVQDDEGAQYGYMRPRSGTPSMTAVGLLCRMYLGAKRSHDDVKRGVKYLASVGPSREDIYYNYYATQVLHHFGSDYWTSWNQQLREFLVETQLKDGPAAGSWNVTDPHGRDGGRIYQTALSILTLEVYYRHLPLYRDLD
jgi:hypothetical protein